MNFPALIILLTIISLFISLLVVKNITGLKFCVMCLSVSATWMIWLTLYWLGVLNDPVFIAVLMGQSAVGVYYLLEKRLAEKYQIFRLPFLLTLTTGVWLVLKVVGLKEFLVLASILGILWLTFFFLYLYRHNSKVKKAATQVIACCRDW